MRDVDESACKAGAVHRWGTDLTSVVTGEGQAAVFVAVDHRSAGCVGIHASHRADRFEALEPLRQGCGGTSAASRRTSPAASRSATTTGDPMTVGDRWR